MPDPRGPITSQVWGPQADGINSRTRAALRLEPGQRSRTVFPISSSPVGTHPLCRLPHCTTTMRPWHLTTDLPHHMMYSVGLFGRRQSS